MINRFSFWVVGADGLIGSGRTRSAGRVLGGGLTVSVRVVEVDDVEGMDGDAGCAEDGGRSWVRGPVLVVWLRRV